MSNWIATARICPICEEPIRPEQEMETREWHGTLCHESCADEESEREHYDHLRCWGIE